jgi:multicomponent Na+:H+ antiporter subunit F
VIIAIVLTAFVLTGACAVARALLGPTLADRVAAFDVALIALMGGIVTGAVAEGDTVALDLLVVVAIVGFTATVAASRFIERRGAAR